MYRRSAVYSQLIRFAGALLVSWFAAETLALRKIPGVDSVDVLFEYQFKATSCAVSPQKFQNEKTDFFNEEVFLIPFAEEVSCPIVVGEDKFFQPSSDGIHLLRDEAFDAVKSDNLFEPNADEWSIELWFKYDIDPATPSHGSNAYTLFELAKDEPVNVSNGESSWLFGDKFSIRLDIRESNQFGIEVPFVVIPGRRSAENCSRATLNRGDIHHLVWTARPLFLTAYLDGTLLCKVFGYNESSSLFQPGTVFVGGGHGSGFFIDTVSTVKAEPFQGDIYLAAMYRVQLTAEQVSAAYAQFLPENSPAVPVKHVLFLVEDENLFIDFIQLAFNLQVVQGVGANEFKVRLLTLPEDGFLSDDNGNILGGNVELSGELIYRQKQPNADVVVDQFTFEIVDVGNQKRSQQGTVEVHYLEVNDPPTAFVEDVFVPLGRSVLIILVARDDNDFGEGEITEDFVPHFITVSETTETLGRFFIVDSNVANCKEGPPLKLGVPMEVASADADGNFVVEVCYQAGIDVVDAGLSDKILGSDLLTFFSTDFAGLGSDNVTANVSVLPPLSAGCGELGLEVCEMVIDETEQANVGVPLVLSSVDHLCVDPVPEIDCASRVPVIRIERPLPDPTTEGELRYIRKGSTIALTLDDDLVGEDGFALDPNDNEVVFVPVKNYFNVAAFPLCVTPTEDIQAPLCSGFFEREINVLAEDSRPTCVGRFCEDSSPFTMGDLRGEVLGACAAASEDGCPVQVFYRLIVDQVLSPLEVAPLRIWIKNQDSGDLVSLRIGQEDGEQIAFPSTNDLLSSFVNVTLDAKDSEATIVKFEITIEEDSSGAELSSSRKDLNLTLSVPVQPVSDSISYDSNGCSFNGNTGNSNQDSCRDQPVTLVGTPLNLNLALENLTVTHLLDQGEVANVVITFKVTSPLTNQFTEPSLVFERRLNLLVSNEDIDAGRKDVLVAPLVGGLVAAMAIVLLIWLYIKGKK